MNILPGRLDDYFMPIIENVQKTNIEKNICIRQPAIIDTGAAEIYLKQSAIDKLELKPIGISTMLHPIDGEIQNNIYRAILSIGEHYFGAINIKVLHSESYPTPIILGCCFLQDKKMLYDGQAASIEIHFD